MSFSLLSSSKKEETSPLFVKIRGESKKKGFTIFGGEGFWKSCRSSFRENSRKVEKKKISRSLEGKNFGNVVAPLFVKIRGGEKKDFTIFGGKGFWKSCRSSFREIRGGSKKTVSRSLEGKDFENLVFLFS